STHLRTVSPGRRLGYTPLRGRRPRPARGQAPARRAGREDRGGQHTWCRHHVPHHDSRTPRYGWSAHTPLSAPPMNWEDRARWLWRAHRVTHRQYPEHGTNEVAEGKLTGATDTDYFHLNCPRCGPE